MTARRTPEWTPRRDKWLAQLLVSDLPTAEVARLMGISGTAINDRAHALGLTARTRRRKSVDDRLSG